MGGESFFRRLLLLLLLAGAVLGGGVLKGALAESGAPVLMVSTLADGAFTGNQLLNVAGRATDAGGQPVASLTIAGLSVPLESDGSFSYPLLLPLGSSTVTVTAVDALGRQSSDTRRITVQSGLPALSVTAPGDNSTSNKSFATVTGTFAAPVAGVAVAVNGGTGQGAALSGSSFSATVNLAAGYNTLEVTVTDLSGKKNSVKRTVYSDTQGPTLNITAPVQDLLTNQGVTLSGSIRDALPPVSLAVSDGVTNYTPSLAGASFSQPLPLGAGNGSTVTVTATEGNGRKTKAQRHILRRFIDNGDGTVTDNLTGLMWSKDANLPGMEYSYEWGLDYAAYMNSANGGLGTLGYNDWRIPSIAEFETLFDRSRQGPALPAGFPFTNVQSTFYWSATHGVVQYHYILGIEPYTGVTSSEHSYNYGYIWPVRGQRATPALVDGVTGAAYNQTLLAGWGVAPHTWTLASGSLPPGITLDAGGALTGTVTRAGSYSFTLQVADARGSAELHQVLLTFSDAVCGSQPVRIVGASQASYPDVMSAYLLAADNDAIQLQALDYLPDLVLSRDVRVGIEGGYACGFTGTSGSSAMLGKLRVTGGTVKLANLRFK